MTSLTRWINAWTCNVKSGHLGFKKNNNNNFIWERDCAAVNGEREWEVLWLYKPFN